MRFSASFQLLIMWVTVFPQSSLYFRELNLIKQLIIILLISLISFLVSAKYFALYLLEI